MFASEKSCTWSLIFTVNTMASFLMIPYYIFFIFFLLYIVVYQGVWHNTFPCMAVLTVSRYFCQKQPIVVWSDICLNYPKCLLVDHAWVSSLEVVAAITPWCFSSNRALRRPHTGRRSKFYLRQLQPHFVRLVCLSCVTSCLCPPAVVYGMHPVENRHTPSVKIFVRISAFYKFSISCPTTLGCDFKVTSPTSTGPPSMPSVGQFSSQVQRINI